MLSGFSLGFVFLPRAPGNGMFSARGVAGGMMLSACGVAGGMMFSACGVVGGKML